MCAQLCSTQLRETMGTDWKDWNVVDTIEGLHVPHFLSGEWESTEEYLEQTDELVTEHWNQFRAMLTEGDNATEGPFNANDTGYTALCQLRERLDSQHEKIQEKLKQWEFKSDLQKLVIAGFEQKVKELALERTRDCEDAEPSEEGFEEALERVLDRPMGEAWLVDNSESLRLLQTNVSAGWQVSPVYMRWASEETDSKIVAPDGPKVSDLKIRYFPEDNHFAWEDIDADSVSRRDVRSFDGDTTWNDALEKLEKPFEAYENQRKQYDRSLKVIEFRRRILKNVLHQFEAYGSVEKMTEERAQEITEESRPGRRSTLNDPETYPAVTLRAVLEWTNDDANRAKPFRSKTQLSLCGFVSERLEGKVGYQVPQDTIKTRLQSLMSDLGVELPHGHTNTRSYFEAREEITEAMEKHDLSV